MPTILNLLEELEMTWVELTMLFQEPYGIHPNHNLAMVQQTIQIMEHVFLAIKILLYLQ